jgi:hypothetical protein
MAITREGLAKVDKAFGLDPDDDDDLDDEFLDAIFRADLLEELAERLGLDESGLEELEEVVQANGVVLADGYDIASYGGFQPRVTPARKCKDCDQPVRPRKSANGPWPQRCLEHTEARRRHMVNGGSKARPQYKPCCIEWQMDGNPDHRGLCQQCCDARKASRKPVSQEEAEWLAGKLGPSGWNIQRPGWLRELA